MDKKIVWTRLKHGQLNVYIAAIEEGLCYLGTPDEDFDDLEKWAKKRLPGYVLIEEEKAIQFYMTELIEYLDGKRKEFTTPISLHGTPFQQSVWRALVDIPFGETVSYTTIAERIGRPTAVRAVGTAIGANPMLIIVPCHRVIGKNGSLTGFRGGLSMKEQLLNLER
ncbi:methylated-DNA--[protein]-cysteine S-methyltransferase [Sporosarcina sp. G11-34]|uniref:methylated-DNA--[protein]-cysteine S-methyltransferase n=1 Tax=Sporosarcina sp. G11-34 TaxID=2849605 RepID=UPI0022A8DB39|nr:methylated-DNA--[protein]-cysteine S-methyltransferase [Sporosarcina sp. G11-34]MCZ2257762.1 methylated-DNA--[protein]-cysteine S-methyltransferase [Sporosarcina sp. G11-34]